jgi:hypothetical protein
MTNKTFCSYHTKRGKPCRNQALANSEPAACRIHHGTPARPPALIDDFSHAKQIIFIPEDGEAESLIPELKLVRHTLHLLTTYLDSPKCVLDPRELREVAGIIFSGARTAATLIQQEGRKGNGLETWFAQALDRLASEYDLEV